MNLLGELSSANNRENIMKKTLVNRYFSPELKNDIARELSAHRGVKKKESSKMLKGVVSRWEKSNNNGARGNCLFYQEGGNFATKGLGGDSISNPKGTEETHHQPLQPQKGQKKVRCYSSRNT